MNGLFSKLGRSGDDAAGVTGPRGARVEISIALLGVVGLCLLAYWVSTDVLDAVYRSVRLLLVSLAVLLLGYVFRLHQLFNIRRVLLLVSCVWVQLLLMMAINSLCDSVPGYNAPGQALLWLPYMLAPTVLAVMVDRRCGVYAAFACTMCGMPLFPKDMPPLLLMNYTIVSLVVGTICAQMAGNVHRREQILRTGLTACLVVLLTLFALMCLQWEEAHKDVQLATLRNGFHFGAFAAEAGVCLAVNFILAALIGGTMPALERLFNISTPITWLEWADMNHPLLKKLQISAPGTFHHSLVVQRLAEAGAEAIGADVTRAGVCGLYHDIGKIENPQYFAENIGDLNATPHANLTPEASARIITGHVTAGVELAQKAGLNRRIVDVISEHHGVSTAYFFYRQALDKYEEELLKFEEGLIDTCPEEVNKADFTYKGPIPQTRESGIVSMADAVESATRSLQHPTEDDIRSMIDGIFKGRILDGHLQDCDLTLGEIAKLKESFFATVRTMHHNRIAYPKPQADDATAALVEIRKEESNSEA